MIFTYVFRASTLSNKINPEVKVLEKVNFLLAKYLKGRKAMKQTVLLVDFI